MVQKNPETGNCYFQSGGDDAVQGPVVVMETQLLRSITVCRSVTSEESIVSMAVSAAGLVAHCKGRTDPQGSVLYSLHVVENGVVRTVIPETTDEMWGLTFLQVAGREQLLVYCEPHVLLMSPGLHRVERKLRKLRHGTQLCRPGENKAFYVQPTGVEGKWEVRELEVTPDTCHDTQKAILTLGWEDVLGMCIAGGLLIMCGVDNNDNYSVARVSLSDWQVRWKVSVEHAQSVCPGTPGSVFVACPNTNTIQPLSLQDGTVLTQLPLVPGVVRPTCVCNHNDTLYVAHRDAELLNTKKQVDWKISQYTFRYESK